MFDAEGGIDAPLYKKGKAHFEHVYSQYNRRAIRLAELEQVRLESAAIDAQDSRTLSPEVEGQESWRVNPLHGFAEYMELARIQQPQFMAAATEIERWIREPCLSAESTPELQKAYM